MRKLFFLLCVLTVCFLNKGFAQVITDTATLRNVINTKIVPNGQRLISANDANRILNGVLNILTPYGVDSLSYDSTTNQLKAYRYAGFPTLTLQLKKSYTNGTVTSVGMSVPQGLTVSPSPITSTGTFTILDTLSNGVVHSLSGAFVSGQIVNSDVHDVAWSKITGAPSFLTLSSLSATSPLQYNNSTGVFSILTGNDSQPGAISASDWQTFNGKQNPITWQNVSAGSSKITLGGTPSGSVFSSFSIDVNEANLTLSNMGGILGISHGGTGASTQQTAINNLLPSQSGKNGYSLVSDGTNVTFQLITGGDSTQNIYVTNGLSALNDSTYMLGGRLNRNTSISGANAYSFLFDSLTTFNVNGKFITNQKAYYATQPTFTTADSLAFVDYQMLTNAIGNIPIAFSQLSDVTFTSLTNAQIPQYNFSTSKWNNVSLTTSIVPEGSNLYWTNTRFDTRFATKTTDSLPEGTTNLYFTQTRARNSISALGPLQYNSSTGVLSIDTTGFGSGTQNVYTINGLTAVNDSTVRLGGNLNQNTTINGKNAYSVTLDSLVTFNINGKSIFNQKAYYTTQPTFTTADSLALIDYQYANSNFWGLNGNSITNTQFIGTTNNQNVVFKRNNIIEGTFYSTGISLGEGTSTNGQTIGSLSAILGGQNDTVTSTSSVILGGIGNKSLGNSSGILASTNSKTRAGGSIILGGGNLVGAGTYSVVLGYFNDSISTANISGYTVGDPALIIGNGTDNTHRANSFTVFNTGKITSLFYKNNVSQDSVLSTDANGNIINIAKSTLTGSGSPNTYLGAGIPLGPTGTNILKTIFGTSGIKIDTTSNTNGVTWKADTALLATQYYVNHQGFLTGITASNGLTATTSTNIALGGSLTQNTTIKAPKLTNYRITIDSLGGYYQRSIAQFDTSTYIYQADTTIKLIQSIASNPRASGYVRVNLPTTNDAVVSMLASKNGNITYGSPLIQMQSSDSSISLRASRLFLDNDTTLTSSNAGVYIKGLPYTNTTTNRVAVIWDKVTQKLYTTTITAGSLTQIYAKAPLTILGTDTIKADTSTALTGLTTLYQNSLKLNISDTSNMLSHYQQKLVNGNGTVINGLQVDLGGILKQNTYTSGKKLYNYQLDSLTNFSLLNTGIFRIVDTPGTNSYGVNPENFWIVPSKNALRFNDDGNNTSYNNYDSLPYYSFNVGYANYINPKANFTGIIGASDTINNWRGYVMGVSNKMGGNVLTYQNLFAIGLFNNLLPTGGATTDEYVLGSTNVLHGDNQVAIGFNNTMNSSANNAIAIGTTNIVNATGSFVAGISDTSTSTATDAAIFGNQNRAKGQGSFIAGVGLISTNQAEADFGSFNDTTMRTWLAVGHGTSNTTRFNVFAIDTFYNAFFKPRSTANRGSSTTAGLFGYNIDSSAFEYADGSAWHKFGSGGGGGSGIGSKTSTTVSTNTTISLNTGDFLGWIIVTPSSTLTGFQVGTTSTGFDIIPTQNLSSIQVYSIGYNAAVSTTLYFQNITASTTITIIKF